MPTGAPARPQVVGDLDGQFPGRHHDQRAAARAACRSAGRPSRCSSGMPNASVLPVPVRAWPMMSWPASAIGQGQRLDRERGDDPGVASAAQMPSVTPSSAKVCSAGTGGTGTGLAGAAAGVATTVTSGAVAGGRGQVCGVARWREAAELIGGRAAGGRISGKCRVLARQLCTISVVRASSLHQWARGRWAHWRARLLSAGKRQVSAGRGPASPGAARAACSRGPATAPEQSATAGGRRTSCHKVHDRPQERARRAYRIPAAEYRQSSKV